MLKFVLVVYRGHLSDNSRANSTTAIPQLYRSFLSEWGFCWFVLDLSLYLFWGNCSLSVFLSVSSFVIAIIIFDFFSSSELILIYSLSRYFWVILYAWVVLWVELWCIILFCYYFRWWLGLVQELVANHLGCSPSNLSTRLVLAIISLKISTERKRAKKISGPSSTRRCSPTPNDNDSTRQCAPTC